MANDATVYVRPSTLATGNNDGTSYVNAWRGWAAITWGAAAGAVGLRSTLWVCGDVQHSSPSVGAHLAASEADRVTIRGDYAGDPGSITVTGGGGSFIGVARDYTTLRNLTMTGNASHVLRLDASLGTRTGVTFQTCYFIGGSANCAIKALATASQTNHYTDIIVTDCDFLVEHNPAGEVGACFSWNPDTSADSIMTRLTISNNRVLNTHSWRGNFTLWIKATAGATCKMYDIRMTGNTFTNCEGFGIDIADQLADTTLAKGRNFGVYVADNTFTGMLENNNGVGTTLGGCINVSGFETSLTSTFPGYGDRNIITNNTCVGSIGAAGFADLFYGTYAIYNNYASDISNVGAGIDGNGLLFDLGCHDCIAYNNEFERITGNPSVLGSGYGILILAAVRIYVYGNKFNGCKHGVGLGNKGAQIGQSSIFSNNIFKDCSYAGMYVSTGSHATNNITSNNIFTGLTNAAYSFAFALLGSYPTYSGEKGNCYYNMAAAVNYTLHATDITTNPLLNTDLTLQSGSPCYQTAAFTGYWSDFTGKKFRIPGSIGAYEYRPAPTRTART